MLFLALYSTTSASSGSVPRCSASIAVATTRSSAIAPGIKTDISVTCTFSIPSRSASFWPPNCRLRRDRELTRTGSTWLLGTTSPPAPWSAWSPKPIISPALNARKATSMSKAYIRRLSLKRSLAESRWVTVNAPTATVCLSPSWIWQNPTFIHDTPLITALPCARPKARG